MLITGIAHRISFHMHCYLTVCIVWLKLESIYVLTVSISFIPLDSVRALFIILFIVTTIPYHPPPTRFVIEVVLPGRHCSIARASILLLKHRSEQLCVHSKTGENPFQKKKKKGREPAFKLCLTRHELRHIYFMCVANITQVPSPSLIQLDPSSSVRGRSRHGRRTSSSGGT